MIREVVLENVKSYDHEKFIFTEGLNAIIGENGAGKTTILEAIGFALFDSLPYKISDFLRRGAKKGSIKISFISSDGREYVVTRNITESGTSEFYLSDREFGRIAEGKEVLQWIREAFRIEGDHKVFFENAIGVLQGKMTAQFLEPPSVRDRIFSPILGIESYKKAYEKSKEYENYVSGKLIEVEKLLIGLEKELELKREIEDELKTLKKRGKDLSREIERVKRDLSRKNERLESLDKLAKEIESLKSRISEIEERISFYSSNLQDLSEKLEKIEEIERRLKEIEECYLRYEDLENRIKNMEREERDLLEKLERLNNKKSELKSLKSNLKSISKEISEISVLERDFADLEVKCKRERELLERLQEIEVREAESKQLAERKEIIQKENSKLTQRIKELRSKKERLIKALKSLEKLKGIEDLRDGLIKKRAELDAEKDGLVKEVSYLREGLCPILKEGCERISSRKAEAERELTEIERKITEIDERLRKLEDLFNTKKRLENVAQKLSGEVRGLKELEDELEAKEAELRGVSSKLKRLSEILKKKEEIMKEYEKVKGSSERFAALRALIDEKKKKEEELTQIEEAIERVEEEIGELLPQAERYERIKMELSQLKTEREELKGFYEEYISSLRLVKEKERILEDLNEVRSKVASMKSKLELFKREFSAKMSKFDERERDKVREEVITLTNLLGNLEGQLKSIERTLKERKDRLERLREREEEYVRKTRERDRLKEKLGFIKDLRDIFKLAIPEITKAYVESVSTEANRLYCEIMGDYNWELEWTEDYGIRTKYRGKEIDFTQMSGGEQMCAAIAVRLALLNVLSNVGIAFFDEPTQNMDEVRRRNLATQLSRIEGFKQIFVISHDNTFEEMVENAIKVTKENGISRAR